MKPPKALKPPKESWVVRTQFPRWLYVNVCGNIVDTEHYCPWRRINDFLLIACVKGKGVYETDDFSQEINTGDIFATLPGIHHSYHSDPVIGWDIWWVHFNGIFASQLLQQAGFTEKNLIHFASWAHAEVSMQFLKKLCGICASSNPHLEAESSACLYELFIRLSMLHSSYEINNPQKRPEPSETEQKLLSAIEGAPQSLEEMARKAGMSKFHFIREFKKHYNLTPWKYIARRRIEVARELLITTDYPIKRIAIECGFNDPNFFSSAFHRETGQSATEFREYYAV